MLVRRYVGSRCGVSSRLTSACRRSASPMITCVYSISCGRSSSRSSSCAAPRMPPSGFLISCARLRISSRFACCCSSSRSSRAIFSCWSMWRNSSSSVAAVRLDRRHRARKVQASPCRRRRARAPARCRTRRSPAPCRSPANSAGASPKTCVGRMPDELALATARTGSPPRGSRSVTSSSSSSSSTAVASSSRPGAKVGVVHRQWSNERRAATSRTLSQRYADA